MVRAIRQNEYEKKLSCSVDELRSLYFFSFQSFAPSARMCSHPSHKGAISFLQDICRQFNTSIIDLGISESLKTSICSAFEDLERGLFDNSHLENRDSSTENIQVGNTQSPAKDL